MVAEEGRRRHCGLWRPAVGPRRLSGPDRCGDGFLRFKTTRDVWGDRVNVAFALAELSGVDKTGQCGQNQRGSKGSVEDKVHKGKRLRVEGRADRGNSRGKGSEARWKMRRKSSAAPRKPGLGGWSSVERRTWRMCKIQAEASSPSRWTVGREALSEPPGKGRRRGDRPRPRQEAVRVKPGAERARLLGFVQVCANRLRPPDPVPFCAWRMDLAP